MTAQGLTTLQAYRLGSMPWRIYGIRFQPSRDPWPREDAAQEVGRLADEALDLLGKIPGRPGIAKIAELKSAVEAEWKTHAQNKPIMAARQAYERFCEHDPTSAPLKPLPLPAPVDTTPLFKALLTDTELNDLGGRLPPTCRRIYRLGQMIGRYIWLPGADREQAIETQIVGLCQQIGVPEVWLTGGNVLSERVGLVAMAMKRIDAIDQLLSSEELPEEEADKEDAAAPNEDYLTVADAARRLQVGEDTVERMIANGELPVIEIRGRGNLGGRKLKRIARDSLDAAMKQRELKQGNPPVNRKRSSPGSDQRDWFAGR